MGRCFRYVLLHAEDYDQLIAAGGGQITLLKGVDVCSLPMLQRMAHTHTHTDNTYWTLYLSFPSIAIVNTLTKCNLEMKTFIFACYHLWKSVQKLETRTVCYSILYHL